MFYDCIMILKLFIYPINWNCYSVCFIYHFTLDDLISNIDIFKLSKIFIIYYFLLLL